MMISLDVNEAELGLLNDISEQEMIRTRSECVRFCIKETAKKILPQNTPCGDNQKSVPPRAEAAETK